MTPKQQRFVEEYLVDLNASQAALRAGYSPRTAPKIGSENLHKPEVQAAVAKLAHKRSEKTGLTAERVLETLAATAFGDVRKLIEYRRTCCRHCWGLNNGYQRTVGEMGRHHDNFVEEERRRKRVYDRESKREDFDGDPWEEREFSEQGGIGWDPRKDPNAACQECFGAGEATVYLHDTRNLDEGARALYAGVKQTKDGIQVLINSQDRARELLGKHLNLFVDRTELTGPGGAPITVIIDTGIPPTPAKPA